MLLLSGPVRANLFLGTVPLPGLQACSLELSHGQQDGKILDPPVGLDPCKTPHRNHPAVCSVATDNCKDGLLSPQGTSAGSVRLLCLLTFQWPYSLKPPGASPETLPCHPSAIAHVTWNSVPPRPAMFYPCSLGGSPSWAASRHSLQASLQPPLVLASRRTWYWSHGCVLAVSLGWPLPI